MSFKVEIEIMGFAYGLCYFCQCKLILNNNTEDASWHCRAFDKVLEFCPTDMQNTVRCPECLEAEKQYKEKENA